MVFSRIRAGTLAAVLGAGLVASACATPEQQIARAAEIKANDDSYLPYVEFLSGAITGGNALGIGGKQLIGRVDRKTGATTTFVKFFIFYVSRNRRVYETARNNRAEQLALTVVQRNARCSPGQDCRYDELFTVAIPEAELRQAAGGGYAFKVFARAGPELLITVPKELIVNLMQKLDAHRAETGRLAATGPSKPQ